MKIRTSIILAFSFILASVPSSSQETKEQAKTVKLDIYYRHDPWIMTPQVTAADGSSSSQAIFYSVERAINPRTGQPYDETQPSFPCDPKDIRNFFRIEKKEFLLGEPILIEHRIEVKSPCHWNWGVGGNYRARGRDDNYFFVLQKADGSIVPDIDLPTRFSLGGLYSSWEITGSKPFSYWFALQRYSAITQPGTYDLYCLTGHKGYIYGDQQARKIEAGEKLPSDHYINENGFLIDRTTGQNSQRYSYEVDIHYLDKSPPPLIDLMPPEVVAYAKEHSFGLPGYYGYGIGLLGHFKITIREGSADEQQQMIEYWTKAAQSINGIELVTHYNNALVDALWYAEQNHFLPLLEKWIASVKDPNDFYSIPLHLDGIAMRPDPAAFSLLLKLPPAQVVKAFYRLPQDRIAEAIPLCINWLTYPDNEVRAHAELQLSMWTGQSFKHAWKGYSYQRPTLEEGQRMQPLWRAWWEKNKSTFRPQKPCPFLCRKPENKDNES